MRKDHLKNNFCTSEHYLNPGELGSFADIIKDNTDILMISEPK